MKIKEFQLTLTNSDSEVLGIKHIAVVDDWENVPEDFNDDLEFDHCFDMSEIRTFGKSDGANIAPNIEESVCKIIYNLLKDDADKLDDTMHGRGTPSMGDILKKVLKDMEKI